MAYTALANLVKPEIFLPYMLQAIFEKSELLRAGIMVRNADLSARLSGGGSTFNLPSFNPIANNEENYSSDQDSSATPDNATTATEIAVRLSRNNAWGSYDLAGSLAGADPLMALASQVGGYWALRLQAALIAMQSGINKDNGANDSEDNSNDIAGASYSAGTTDFSASALLDAIQTAGDQRSMFQGGALMVHSEVATRMQKNDLITFTRDSDGTWIRTFHEYRLIVDDGMPSGTNAVRGDGSAGAAGVYESWLVGPGYYQLGEGTAPVPTETDREPLQGDGGGRESLVSRVEWMLHAPGHAYTGTAPISGPTNAATTNNLNIATSWDRVFARKQIPFCRLVTRES